MAEGILILTAAGTDRGNPRPHPPLVMPRVSATGGSPDNNWRHTDIATLMCIKPCAYSDQEMNVINPF